MATNDLILLDKILADLHQQSISEATKLKNTARTNHRK